MATFETQIYKTSIVRLCDDFPCDIISNNKKNSCVQEIFYLSINCLQGTRDLSRRGSILGTISTRWLEPLSFTAISEQIRTSSQSIYKPRELKAFPCDTPTYYGLG